MRELSKTEITTVSGAGLLGEIANIAGKITNSAVHTVAGMVSVWTSGISYGIGATVGLGVSFVENIANMFKRK